MIRMRKEPKEPEPPQRRFKKKHIKEFYGSADLDLSSIINEAGDIDPKLVKICIDLECDSYGEIYFLLPESEEEYSLILANYKKKHAEWTKKHAEWKKWKRENKDALAAQKKSVRAVTLEIKQIEHEIAKLKEKKRALRKL